MYLFIYLQIQFTQKYPIMKGGTRFNYPKPTLHKRNKEEIKLFGLTHTLNQEKKNG